MSISIPKHYTVTQLVNFHEQRLRSKRVIDVDKRNEQRTYLETQGYGFEFSSRGFEVTLNGEYATYETFKHATRPDLLLELAVISAWKHRKENK